LCHCQVIDSLQAWFPATLGYGLYTPPIGRPITEDVFIDHINPWLYNRSNHDTEVSIMDYSESDITGLVRFDAAKAALEIATSVDEVVEIRNRAEAMRVYARQAHFSLKMQNQCCELKIRAERKGGQLLGEMQLNGGDRKSESHHARVKLDDIGIDKDKSARWQSIASIPEKIFEEHIAKTVGTEEELTSSSLLNIAHNLKIKQRRAKTQDIRGKNIITRGIRYLL